MSKRLSYPKTHMVPNCCECDQPLKEGHKIPYEELIICRACYLKLKKAASREAR